MLDFNRRGEITITCHKFIAPALQQEVQALGFTVKDSFATGLTLLGSLNDCIHLNLNLYCASQVLYKLRSFTANHVDDVYNAVSGIDWLKIMDAEGYFSVTSNVHHPTINNSTFANLRVKDAIVDQIREKTGKRPNTGAALDGLVVHLFWKDSNAAIFLDTSGQSLGRHGYRKLPGKAPMLEALAAATIISSNWDRATPFINPMCGSGTLAIEASMIASNRKPGLYRSHYAFKHIKGFDDIEYAKAARKLKAQIKDEKVPVIRASDISTQAVEVAIKNAKAAGVQHLIDFQVCDFAATEVSKQAAGVVFLNPEYGQRLGEEERLEPVYSRIGDFFKQQCEGYTGYVFTANPNLARKIGLKAKRKIPFYNAKLECRLLEFELYKGRRGALHNGNLNLQKEN